MTRVALSIAIVLLATLGLARCWGVTDGEDDPSVSGSRPAQPNAGKTLPSSRGGVRRRAVSRRAGRVEGRCISPDGLGVEGVVVAAVGGPGDAAHSAVSGSSGAFQLTFGSPGRLVVCRKPGFATCEWDTVTRPSPAQVVLSPGGCVSGQVLGVPVSVARVVLERCEGWGWIAPESVVPPSRVSVVLSEDGTFAFSEPICVGRWSVRLDGRQGSVWRPLPLSVRYLDLQPSRETRVVLKVSTTASIEGRVCDQDGAPIPQAVVRVRHNPLASGFQVSCDDEGRFSEGGLVAGHTYELSAEAEGYHVARCPGGAVPGGGQVKIVLRPGPSLVLRFRGRLDPVRVDLREARGTVVRLDDYLPIVSATANWGTQLEGGSLRIPRVSPYRGFAVAFGRSEPITVGVVEFDGRESPEVEVVLRRLSSFEVAVRSLDGSSVSGAEVVVVEKGVGARPSVEWSRRSTNALGVATLQGPEGGSVFVFANKEGVSSPPALIPLHSERRLVKLVLDERSEVVGALRPVAIVDLWERMYGERPEVCLLDSSLPTARRSASAEISDDGRFRVLGVSAGTWRLAFVAESEDGDGLPLLRGLVGPKVVVRRGSGRVDLGAVDLGQRTPVDVRGELRIDDGVAAGMCVVASRLVDGLRKQVASRTDRSGRFLLLLNPGRWQFCLSRRSLRIPLGFVVVGPAIRKAPLQLSIATKPVSFAVVDRFGRPQQGVRLVLGVGRAQTRLPLTNRLGVVSAQVPRNYQNLFVVRRSVVLSPHDDSVPRSQLVPVEEKAGIVELLKAADG